VIAALRADREAVSPFVFSLDAGPPSPARIGVVDSGSPSRRDPKWRLHDLRHRAATAVSAAA